jgi:hypothetical protein
VNYSPIDTSPINLCMCFDTLDIYQLGIQAASTLLSSIDCLEMLSVDFDGVIQDRLRSILDPVVETERDFEWICEAIVGSLCMQ